MAGDNVEVNKQHFDKEAAAYEDKPFILEWASNVNAVMQRELSSLPADAACLDFGCGPGALSALLATRYATVVGLDVSPNMIERYNAKAASKGLANMTGITADVLRTAELAEQLSQRQLPQQYDLIFSLMAPHHMDNLEAVTAALTKLLKPSGCVVFVDMLKTPTSVTFHSKHGNHTVAHVGGFDEQGMQALYQGAGLRLVKFIPAAITLSKEADVGDGQKGQIDAFMAIGTLA